MLIKNEHPVARKRHQCQICGCGIEPGTRYFRQVSDHDGMGAFKAHDECVRYEHKARLDICDDTPAPEATRDAVLTDLGDILGTDSAAEEFMYGHSLNDCVRYVLEHLYDDKNP